MRKNDSVENPIVLWNLTNECNLHCRYCYQNAGKAGEELSLPKKISLVDEFCRANVWAISFGGGEPLLRKEDLCKISNYARTKGIEQISIVTNGTLLTQGTIRELKDNGINRFSISIYSLDEKVNDICRGRNGSWKKTIEGILNSIAEGIETEITATITQRNFSGLERFIQFGRYLGVDEIEFTTLIPVRRGKNVADECLNSGQMESALRTAAKYYSNGQRMMLSCNPEFTPYLKDYLKNQGVPQSTLLDYDIGCMAGVGWCVIQPDGKVTPCVLMPDLIVGDVKDESFVTIWQNSSLFNKMRDRNNLKGSCGSCEDKYICGGCRARAYSLTGDPLREDPSCVVYEHRNVIKNKKTKANE